MSIRLRLTLLYSAILALTLLVFGGVLYAVVDQASLRAAQDQLKANATLIVAALKHQASALPDLRRSALTIQLRGPDGTIVNPSPDQQSTETLPLDPSALDALQNGNSIEPYVVTVGGQQLLLYDTDITFGDRLVGILQVAQPLQVAERRLDTVRRVLLGGGAIATLLAFGIGWLLAGTALRPINRITQTAHEIGAARDFGRRVAYTGPPDEVGRLATTFNAMLARLQEAYQAQRRFVADASHELRTPLTTIRGNLGLLQREPPIAEIDRVAVIADLVSESERLSRLVGDLLTLARRDAGRPLRREPVPLDSLLADLLRRLAVLYPGRMIHAEGHSDAAAIGDPDALTQVLLILLDNALKFTPADSAVTVATTVEGGHVSIAVRDTGPGIAPDALPHIFERFYQGDVARAETGAGLGLAIAKALVEGQHGTIAVESHVGQGSIFTVTLPRATVAPRPAHAHVSGS